MRPTFDPDVRDGKVQCRKYSPQTLKPTPYRFPIVPLAAQVMCATELVVNVRIAVLEECFVLLLIDSFKIAQSNSLYNGVVHDRVQ
jgi:hypothetical protein